MLIETIAFSVANQPQSQSWYRSLYWDIDFPFVVPSLTSFTSSSFSPPDDAYAITSMTSCESTRPTFTSDHDHNPTHVLLLKPRPRDQDGSYQAHVNLIQYTVLNDSITESLLTGSHRWDNRQHLFEHGWEYQWERILLYMVLVVMRRSWSPNKHLPTWRGWLARWWIRSVHLTWFDQYPLRLSTFARSQHEQVGCYGLWGSQFEKRLSNQSTQSVHRVWTWLTRRTSPIRRQLVV